MNRWFSPLLAAPHALGRASFALVAVLGLHAFAQAPQHFIPDAAPFAYMQVTQAPELRLDDQAARLAPGARIYSPEKMLVLSASLSAQRVPVRYRLDDNGQVIEVWMLRPDELPAFAGVRLNWATRQDSRQDVRP